MNQINYAFSMHKSGSTLFFEILRDICDASERLGLPNKKKYFAISQVLANRGIGPEPLKDPDFLSKYDFDLSDEQTIYGGFRFVPAFFTGAIEESAAIMGLVRDPRDLLTSHYYSMSNSHAIPPGEPGKDMMRNRERLQKMSIDEFILDQIRREVWLERSRRLIELAQNLTNKFWRYEDVIFEKERWLDEILSRIQLELPQDAKDKILKKRDIVPEEEDASVHIRKVTPGDHREKLKAATIDALHQYFADVLTYWDYH